MRILHIITNLGAGGAERVLLDLASTQAALGHEVLLVSLGGNCDALERGVDPRVAIRSVGLAFGSFAWIRRLWQVTSEMRTFRPDVLHAHMFHALLFAVFADLLVAKAPLVFTSHSSRIRGFARRLFVRFSRNRRRADVVFSSRQHASLNCAHVVVIPNGIPIPDLAGGVVSGRKVGSPWRFICVANLTKPKNHAALIEQFAILARQGVCAELWLVGEGELRGDIEEMLVRHGLEGRVSLLGRRSDVPALLRQADGFVLSSFWEGMPIAVLEAGAAGLPVIATPVGSLPDLLSDGCGILAQSCELSNAMIALMENPDEAREMGLRLRERVTKHYSIRSIAIAHIQLYELLSSNVYPEVK